MGNAFSCRRRNTAYLADTGAQTELCPQISTYSSSSSEDEGSTWQVLKSAQNVSTQTSSTYKYKRSQPRFEDSAFAAAFVHDSALVCLTGAETWRTIATQTLVTHTGARHCKIKNYVNNKTSEGVWLAGVKLS